MPRNAGPWSGGDLAADLNVHDLPQPREATNTAVARAGDLLFLLNDDGELIVARSNPARLDIVKRYAVADSSTGAQPVISGRRVFIKDASSLALWTID